jgi:curli production assembly/transport component CsgG
MNHKFVTIISSVFLLAGCATPAIKANYPMGASAVEQTSPSIDLLLNVPELDGEKMTIGVYSFTDKTGQRKPADNVASLSSAVTQGSEAWVIDALMKVGDCTWFQVVERSGMDNLIKERQLIRNTRQNYDNEPEPLTPMLFAGLLLEGGIVGYDSNVVTGGTGARYFGIGASEKYRVDTVTVALRLVSVNTGKVLLTVATEKTIASQRVGGDVFKFLDMGTKALEIENGFSINEPVNYAVREAIEAGVIELVYEGERKGLWSYKKEEIE